MCFVSKIEPKNVNEAVNDEYWCTAMQEELIQFEKNQVWELVPKPSNVNIIGTKWIFKNKSDELGTLLATRRGWWHKGTLKSKGWTLKKHLRP